MTRRSSGITAPSPASKSRLQLHNTPRGSGGGGRISILSPSSSLSSSNQKQQQQQQQQQHHGSATHRGSAFKVVMRKSLDRLSSSTSTLTTSTPCCDDDDADGVAESEAVKVCVRIRPLFDTVNNGTHYHQLSSSAPRAYVLGPIKNTIVKNSDIIPDNNCSSYNSSNNATYSFNHVYGETSTTRQVYDDMVAEIVESVGFQGRNGTVFTYGQTSTGKTHTMHGILMAAGKDLFAMRDQNVALPNNEHGRTAPSSRTVTSVRMSCMEIYNEELRDLLCSTTTPSSSTSLSIQEDRRGNVQIPGLTERIVDNIDELMEVIQIAEENRSVGSTAMNERSSRSHTIFRVTYEKKETTTSTTNAATTAEGDNDREEKENDHHSYRVGGGSNINNNRSPQRNCTKVMTTVSTLNLVDLAGSESVRVTGAVGERQKEGGKINQSLLTLSQVLSKLGKKDGRSGHINYRDSKLTRILKPSLSGNARMGCICCISPAVQYVEESKSTLDFAMRTMLVTTNAKSNHKIQYDDALTEEFEREIERIQQEKLKSEESRLQMQRSLQKAEDQIVKLRASVDSALRKISSTEMEKNEYMLQVEELQYANKTNTDDLRKELHELKEHNHELEENLRKAQSEKSEQQTKENERIVQELKRKEKEQKVMAERHKEELESVCTKIQTGIHAKIEELRVVRANNTETIAKLTNRVAELERTNEDLASQLSAATTASTIALDVAAATASHEEEIASLKSTIETLSEEKLQLEWKLRREAERKAGAKDRRQMLKARVASLKEDFVQLSNDQLVAL
ncbi:hypothetical protein ACHAWU_004541 [Discostella pseudostelligera]|uniref:Kinesin-like protein n=1 Tax=Discostella pseudostelligera TaxID=259834 RepID=A0ABD3MT13_9STRA